MFQQIEAVALKTIPSHSVTRGLTSLAFELGCSSPLWMMSCRLNRTLIYRLSLKGMISEIMP
jgi:hypothetical protein